MAGIWEFKTHRNWEDWLGMMTGVLIGLSPAFVEQQYSQTVIWNGIVIGLLVLWLAAMELVNLNRAEEFGEIACGAWLIASPFVLGYADTGALRYWHFALGAFVVLLAVVELYQDWNLSDRELAEHGR